MKLKLRPNIKQIYVFGTKYFLPWKALIKNRIHIFGFSQIYRPSLKSIYIVLKIMYAYKNC